MGLGAAGAGATGGLDEYLGRLMAQAKLQEETRANQANEGLKGRQLDQSAALQPGTIARQGAETANIESETVARGKARDDKAAQEGRLTAMLNDPNTPPAVKAYLQGESALPAGRTLPYELITEPNGPPKPPGPIEDTPGGLTRVNPDNTSTLLTGPDKKPLTRYHPAVQPVVLQTDQGVSLVDRAHGTASPVTQKTTDGTVGPQVQPKQSAAAAGQEKNAGRARDTLGNYEKLLEEANGKGLIGPGAGRIYADFLSGTVGTTGNPDADQLLGELRLDGNTLPPLIALSIGEGARGASNVGLLNQWKTLYNTHGVDTVRGVIKGTRKLLGQPKATPGVTPADTADPLGLFAPTK